MGIMQVMLKRMMKLKEKGIAKILKIGRKYIKKILYKVPMVLSKRKYRSACNLNYNRGYSDGDFNGYEEGYNTGKIRGYTLGFEDGTWGYYD